MRNRRGFTLVELMIGMIIMLVVTGAVYKLLTTTQRLSRAQAERTDLQSNVRTTSIVVPNELREINTVEGSAIASQNDILAASGTSITYRAMRGMGYVCQSPTSTDLRITKSTFDGTRTPVAGRDSAYVFMEGADPDQGSDDTWQPVPISAVDPNSTCGATAAYKFTINPSVATLTAANVPVGTPVRVYEVMQLSLYANGGQSWLGARSVSANEASQPVLGPLVSGTGLSFEYLDKNAGNSMGTLNGVKTVRMTVRGITDDAIVTGASSAMAHVQDSLVSEVQLRNAFRP
ncbi:MAG TPA: prepilin-type N-terminal cleavage/methylation domain-containing protein [Gemmatimonadales bacterium]